jgi:hypothetical protein
MATTRQLKASRKLAGKRRAELAMRHNGIRVRGKLRFRMVTTDSNHALPIVTYLLPHHFNVARANTV